MSVHKECGETIEWARREDNKGWAPPYEFAGWAYMLTEMPESDGEKQAVQVATYRPHQCDPEKIIAWREYQARLAEIDARLPAPQNTRSAWQIKREKEREETWELVLPFECETCGAGVSEYCTSRTKGPSFGSQLRNPHPSRLAKAEENQ